MKIKGAAAIETEKAQHEEYAAFCQKTLSEKQNAIDEGKDRIERLQADIEKFKASVTTLTSDLQMHTKEIATAEQDAEKTSTLRDQEVVDYTSTLKEYDDSIGAIGKALDLLKAQKGGEVAQMLTQLPHGRVGRELSAFLQGNPKAYDFQSQGVVDMLDKLRMKFQQEKTDLEKAEADKKTSHDLVMASLKKQKTTASEAKQEKTEFKSKAEQNLANAKADLEESTSTLGEDTKYHKDLKMEPWLECKNKAEEFASSQKLRDEEVDAIAKASEIIASVSGFLQSSTSLALLRSTPGRSSALRSALQLLRAGDVTDAQRALIQQLEAVAREDSELRRNDTLDGASKQTDAQHFAQKKTEQSQALAQKQADLASSKTELASAEEYHQELAKQCLSSESDAAKQKAHREEEIENLKTALKKLD
eukprot:Skav229205  [mRNA]  locus=scaffold2439:65743:70530:+ [translate_table: standard]